LCGDAGLAGGEAFVAGGSGLVGGDGGIAGRSVIMVLQREPRYLSVLR
jgi:hypothetical protein